MNLNYELTESDYLEYHLYTASKSKLNKKTRFRTRIIIPIIYTLFALYSAINDKSYVITITFVLISIIWYVFYPRYSKWANKRRFQKHIDENYKNRINKPVEISFNEDSVYSKDFSTETKIKGSELNELNEIKNHFFIKLKTGLSLIVPKRAIINQAEFIKKVTSLGAEHIDELNWEWK
ncbi:YcxB family protein [Algibacter sp. L1A34]|uniref:YcxB family protein n=1 Tax=Algibacter sp. L1A34 TaxID=2686365 RepID=UPI00131E663B|nr:YcxB family protein [Algibacter sp. L1A34]